MSQKSFTAPVPEDLAALLPSYSVTGQLSKTKKSAIYCGLESEQNLPVQIELLSEAFTSASSFQELFDSQLAEQKELEHSNIAKVYDSGLIEGMPYVVSELIEGNTLAQSSGGKTIDAEQAADIVMAVAEGVGYAHGQGVFHTDIKPQNIFLDQEATPYLVNFGSYTKIRSATGKPDYGSPGYAARETLSGEFCPASDLYSLGAIFYELITGSLPKLPYQNPSEFESCDARFDQFLAKALAPQSGQRHCSAEEFITELSAALQQTHSGANIMPDIGVPITTQAVPVGDIPTSPVVDSGLASSSGVAYKDSMLPFVMVGVAAVAVLGGLSVLWVVKSSFSSRDSQPALAHIESIPLEKPLEEQRVHPIYTASHTGDRTIEEISPIEKPKNPTASKEKPTLLEGALLEKSFVGRWRKGRGEGGPSFQFNLDRSARKLNTKTTGLWEVRGDNIYVDWEAPDHRRTVIYEMRLSEPDIVRAVEEGGRLRFGLYRTEPAPVGNYYGDLSDGIKTAQ